MTSVGKIPDCRVAWKDTQLGAKTETKFGEMMGELRLIRSDISHLPTKRDLDSWKLQWLAIGLASAIGGAAIIVGGIIGGLDWIKVH